MALPFYVVAARQEGLSLADAAILLGAQTAGALASNIAWGRIGDQFGKLRLLEFVGTIRLLPPLGALFLLYSGAVPADAALAAFMLVFFILGALINGTTIGNLGFLMEISPDDRRPAYSAYFNVLAAPAALLPILGAVLVDVLSLEVLFIAALAAAGGQLILFRRLRTEGAR
jgi:MFS family permease